MARRRATRKRTTGGEQTVYFEEASQFEVDAEAAWLFVTQDLPVVDGRPVHRSVTVKKFVADNATRLRLTNALGKSRPTGKVEMIDTGRRHLHRRQKEPRMIRSLFKEKHVRYAA